ncbi:MAG TPA: glutamyl-tRNA reductase [Sedimentisphaerales bacterium]|nr:glutamyl-tRNA reductase [Sedimentisphaerales bacterium]
MKIIALGLNHKTAPVDVREKLAFNPAQTIRALRLLKDKYRQAEFVLLSTCNRVELYCAGGRTEGVEPENLIKFLAEFHDLPARDFGYFLYIHRDEEAVGHLLTVASSLDSLVVGEVQIISQVKEAYRLACTAKSTGKVLNRLFHCAFATSKKVHTNTAIAGGRVSVAGFAVELARQLFANIASAKVVVIGAGEMSELLVRHLLHEGCEKVTIVNRSYERGLERAQRLGVEARKWEDLEEQLIGANIVVGSAGAQDYLFSKDAIAQIMTRRRQAALLIIDIAVPRNFEPAVNQIENVYLYSVDDLSAVVEQNLKAREADMAQGMHIVHESVTEFMDWFRAREIGPLIGQMKEQFARIMQDELERFFVGTRQDASCRDVMEPMVKRIVNKLLHCVISNVNAVAKEHGPAEAAKLIDSIVRQAEEIAAAPDNGRKTQS